jgi:pimeloyl-ACP methyl ester carboxylesterase
MSPTEHPDVQANSAQPGPMTVQVVDVGTGGLRAHLRRGEEPALVFLHYWGGSHRTWTPVVDRLPSHHGIVTYDQRGWGASIRMPGPFSLDQLADDAQHVVEYCDLSSYVLVGHSMGGKVAPAPPVPVGVTASQQDALLHAYDDAETVGQAIDHALTRNGLSPGLRTQVVEDSLGGSPGAREEWPRRGIVQDIGDEVTNIDVPVLVLAGDDDRVDPPDTLAAHLLPRIPTATMQLLTGTGHLAPLEVPDQISGYVERFVAGVA